MAYNSIKISLDSYDGIAGLREHVQNVYNNLDLIIQKTKLNVQNPPYNILRLCAFQV